MTRRPSTLRTRLVAASLLASIVAIVAANTLAYFGLRGTLLRRVDSSLRTVRLPKDDKDGGRDDAGGGPRRLPSTFYFEERSTDGTVLDHADATDRTGRAIRPDLPRSLDVAGTSGDPDGPAHFFTVNGIATTTRFRVKASTFSEGRVLILAATLDDMDETLARTLRTQIGRASCRERV